ncbi:10017_t:CDS:1, partial [Ambispora gerdemannii]
NPNNDPADCNGPGILAFQINIPISEVFWNPPIPILLTYVPVIPPTAKHNWY